MYLSMQKLTDATLTYSSDKFRQEKSLHAGLFYYLYYFAAMCLFRLPSRNILIVY